MKPLVFIVLFGVFAAVGCASNPFFAPKIGAEEIIAEKEAIDRLDNPAMRYRKLNALSYKKIFLENILVKDVIESPRVDYAFCVLAELNINDHIIECYIYSANIKTVSRLKKQESIIDITGTFQRFFSTLDDYDTKLEIANAKITTKAGNK